MWWKMDKHTQPKAWRWVYWEWNVLHEDGSKEIDFEAWVTVNEIYSCGKGFDQKGWWETKIQKARFELQVDVDFFFSASPFCWGI